MYGAILETKVKTVSLFDIPVELGEEVLASLAGRVVEYASKNELSRAAWFLDKALDVERALNSVHKPD